MVTHNEDLECYGDRVIFFEDGKIKKQVFNDFQFALDAEEYSQFLNTKVWCKYLFEKECIVFKLNWLIFNLNSDKIWFIE